MGSTASSSLQWVQIVIHWKTTGYCRTSKCFPKHLPGGQIVHRPTFTLATTRKILHVNSPNYKAIHTTERMYWPTRLVKGAANSVSAFVGVFWKILNGHLGPIPEILVKDGIVRGPKSRYGEEKVEGLPGVWKFLMQHLQQLDTFVPIWSELDPPFPVRSLTGAGME